MSNANDPNTGQLFPEPQDQQLHEAEATQLHAELQQLQTEAPAGAAAAPGQPAHLTIGGLTIPPIIVEELKSLSVEALQWVMSYAMKKLSG